LTESVQETENFTT